MKNLIVRHKDDHLHSGSRLARIGDYGEELALCISAA